MDKFSSSGYVQVGGLMSEPLLTPLNYLDHLSVLVRPRALTLRIPPCEWLAPHTADLFAHKWGTNPPTLAFKILPLVGSQ
jgi:hypothetical protein